MNDPLNSSLASGVTAEMPNEAVQTPCFVIFEEAVRHNLRRTAESAGGIGRLMPHVKTHRSPWLTELLLEEGVKAFKCATPAEVEMVLAAGAAHVTWAYPSVNPAVVRRFVSLAQAYPDADLTGILDSARGLALWTEALREGPDNVTLRVDLDAGMHRTGVPMGGDALTLARAVHGTGRFVGWHIYDGHVHGDRATRQAAVDANADKLRALQDALLAEGIEVDAVGAGSYTFDLWPHDLLRYVSPGSWIFSSAQHDVDLPELGWKPAAFVLSTVISSHEGTVTLDAGVKAISPDKPLAERFRWEEGAIRLMSEEHAVVEAEGLVPGDRVYLLPQHACTTAYLYDEALVKAADGRWDRRAQLGSTR